MFGLEFLVLGVIIVVVVRSIVRRRSVTGESAALVARRVFQYLAMVVTLALCGFGIAGMLEAILATEGGFTGNTSLVARSVAFLLVGVPSFIGLALFTRKRLAAEPDEVGSLGWSLYLSITTLGALIGMVVSGSILLGALLHGDGFTTVAALHLLVWGTVWSTHWIIGARLTEPERMRPARLLGSLVGLVTTVWAASIVAGQGLTWIYVELSGLTTPEAGWDRMAGAMAFLILGVLVWAWYWMYAARPDRGSMLTVTYTMLAGVLPGVVMVASGLGVSLFLTFEWLLTVQTERAASFFIAAPTALGIVLIGGATWVYHRTILRTRGAERTEVHRTYDYILSGVGGAVTAGGIGTLLVAGLRALSGLETANLGGTTVAAALALIVVGVPIWWRHWRRVQLELRSDPSECAARLSRRIYLPVIVGVGALTVLVSSIVSIFILVQGILDGLTAAQITNDIAIPLAIVLTAGAAVGYHGALLWADRKTLASLEPRSAVREVILVSDDGDAVIGALAEAHIRVQRLHAAAPIVVTPSVEGVMDTLGAETHQRVVVLSSGDHFEVVPVD